MKKYLLLFLLAVCVSGHAQTSLLIGHHSFRFGDDLYYGSEIIDTSLYKVNYDMVMVIDSLAESSSDKYLLVPEVLLVGKRVWKYCTGNHYSADSLMALTGCEASGKGETEDATWWDVWYHNWPSGRSTFTGRLCADNYKYDMPSDKIVWKILDNTRHVAGYECRLAKCSLAGRDYTVWFTMQIPVPAGPWRLGGLPGLIVKASSDDGAYDFTLKSFSPYAEPFGITKYDYINVSRKQYRKLQRQMFYSYFDFVNYHAGNTGIKINQNAKNSSYTPRYDLIEKD